MKMSVKIFCVAMFSISLASGAEGLSILNGIPSSPTLKGFSLSKNQWPSGYNIKCNEDYGLYGIENLFKLTTEVVAPVGVFACSGARLIQFSRFTVETCRTALTCRNNLENSGVDVKNGEKAVNDLIAIDFIKKSMIVNSDEMERFQIMKKFAQEKYDKKFGEKCLNRFTTQGLSQCSGPLMEKAFEERQSECKFGVGCYKNDDTDLGLDSFTHFRSKNDDKVGSMVRSYFNYRTKNAVKKRLSEDDVRIQSLAALATNAEYKKAKTDQKINFIVEAIGRDANNRLKDPILGFEFGDENPTSSKNADKFKEILKMLESKTASTDFAANFNAFRKQRAEKRLTGENSCAQTSTMINICNEATLISQGQIVPKGADIAINYTSVETSKAGIDYEVLKSNLGAKFDEQDYNSLLNARRCVAFGITDNWGNPLSDPTKESLSSVISSSASTRMNKQEAMGVVASGTPNDSDVKVNPNGTDTSIVDQAGLRGLKVAGMEEKASGPDEVDGVDSAAEAGQFTNSIGQVPQGQIGSNFSDMYNNSNFESFSPKAKIKTEEEANPEEFQSTASSTSTAQEKMNDYLMKKLAAAEENLEKLKADTADAEEAREKQKKVDEEAALIKDLKGQIADLKSQTVKNAERKIARESESEEARPSASNIGHAFSSSGLAGASSATRAESIIPKAQAPEKFDAGQVASQASQSAASRSGSGSGAILSSVSNPDGSKTTTLGSGLVVTTVDGMSLEKVQQTISNRILELNGSPFYIEEGGLVKEIIAVVKDGKVLLDEKGNPIFEKIVKGKVGDKKFASKIKDKKEAREPASITDVADLKRDQEEKLKRERAEYIKLKNITNGALKKK